ncbi:hypothetical protein [Comamonas terrae]|uniref:Uncharacterized protein n=1 Tax=Comamonas terrae TaxID=673548 RepID=A0ABW5URG9_9BURK|nr:hypothetical protein [Comamonas terrae]
MVCLQIQQHAIRACKCAALVVADSAAGRKMVSLNYFQQKKQHLLQLQFHFFTQQKFCNIPGTTLASDPTRILKHRGWLIDILSAH